MARSRNRIALPLTIFGLACISLFLSPGNAKAVDTGSKGAQIYCFMRGSGNSHEVSWNASYEVIKRQANSLFKTSPKHGAVMITEAVVQNPQEYNNCGKYLGDLFAEPSPIEIDIESRVPKEKGDRYSY